MPFHFEADFTDNTTYVQGEDDLSLHEEGKNAFFDVLQREALDEVLRFHLIHETKTRDGKAATIRYTVDLKDGHFEIDGIPFTAHDQFFEAGKEKLRIAYWKEMHQTFEKTGDEMVHKGGYCNRYFIGWRTEEKNKKAVQQTIAIGGIES